MKKARVGITAIALLALGLILFCDFWRNSIYTIDFFANTVMGYALGVLIGYLWPWPRKRDALGRFVKS